MDDIKEKKEIKESVLKAIADGRVSMRPRWHFVLTAALAATGIVILGLAILYLASFIFFVLRETGILFVPAFGASGFFAFMRALPWLLILLTIVFVAILEVLVRRFAFAYRRPLAYSVLGIVGTVLLGGFLIVQTSFHHELFVSAAHHELPIVGGFYRNFGMPHSGDDVHHGTVLTVIPGGFVIQDLPFDETDTILISPATQLPSDFTPTVGERVVIFGDESGTIIQAFGIRSY
jgi:hypothetical protein